MEDDTTFIEQLDAYICFLQSFLGSTLKLKQTIVAAEDELSKINYQGAKLAQHF